MVDISDIKIEADADEAAAPAPTAAQAPPAAPEPKLAAEQWAERKGHLPEFFPVMARAGHLPVAPRHNPKFWMFAGARAASGWPIGAEVTEAEFDAAIVAASTGVSR